MSLPVRVVSVKLKSTCASVNLDQLPSELLTVIFRQLPLDDRKSVRLVCRRFHDVCTHWHFTQNEKFVFRQGCVDNSSIVEFLRGCNYSASNLEFVRMAMNEIPNSVFLSSDSQQIRHLTLNECSFSVRTITKIITYCCDLQYLKVTFNDDTKAMRKTMNLLRRGTIFAELIRQKIRRTSLTEFELIIREGLEDERFPWNAIITKILTIFPNIRSFVCLGIWARYKFKPDIKLEELIRQSKLEAFCFSVPVDNLWLEKITRLPGLRLRKMSVAQAHGENLTSCLQCFQNQTELTELDLTLWHDATHEQLESFLVGVLQSCDNLRRLRVQERHDPEIRKQFTTQVVNLLLDSRLELVELPFDDGVWTGDSDEYAEKPLITNTTLQTLILNGCSISVSSRYASIFEYFTNLAHLEVKFADNVTLQTIFKYETNLRCLTLYDLICTDYGFVGNSSDTKDETKETFSIARLKNLEFLYLNCKQDKNILYPPLSEAILHNFNLPKLKVLFMAVDSIIVTKWSLVALARNVPSLEYFCGIFHNTPKDFVDEFLKHTRKLRVFSYAGIRSVIMDNRECRLTNVFQTRNFRFMSWQLDFYYFNPLTEKSKSIVARCCPDGTHRCACGFTVDSLFME